MAFRIGMNLGFVTNSSSVVYHFPAEVLKDPRVQAFLEGFEVRQGFVGDNMWSREACSSVAFNVEQKEEIRHQMSNNEYAHGPEINTEDDSVVIVYDDEYQSLASSLAHLMAEVARQMGINLRRECYN